MTVLNRSTPESTSIPVDIRPAGTQIQKTCGSPTREYMSRKLAPPRGERRTAEEALLAANREQVDQAVDQWHAQGDEEGRDKR